jgi:hypothetical protein
MHGHRFGGEPPTVDPPADVEHQQRRVELVGPQGVHPPLPPHAYLLDHGEQFHAGCGEPVARFAIHDPPLHQPGALQFAKSGRQQRRGHPGNAARDRVESFLAQEQLADHEQRPSLGEDLGGPGDRAVLPVALHVGPPAVPGHYRNRTSRGR